MMMFTGKLPYLMTCNTVVAVILCALISIKERVVTLFHQFLYRQISYIPCRFAKEYPQSIFLIDVLSLAMSSEVQKSFYTHARLARSDYLLINTLSLTVYFSPNGVKTVGETSLWC